MNSIVLVVDDEPSVRRVLQAHLVRMGFEVLGAASGREAVEALRSSPVDLVLTDLKMPEMDGMALLAHVQAEHPGLPVIMLTAHGTIDTAVEAIRLGALDYLEKPWDERRLQDALEKGIRTERARRRSLEVEAGAAVGRFNLIGRTPSMQRVYTLVEKVADSPSTVLLSGESGTGKELVARALHGQSSRRDKPFIAVNCGAIPENLFESELFGFEKGSFTGATSGKPGRFELADGGTLFLDEVGDLPKDMQVKLLRVLQERVVERVGSLRPTPVDVRVIAATNVDLEEAIQAGRFRSDLYFRLDVIHIQLPPLRDRKEDIPLLVRHFLQRFNQRLNKQVTRIDDAALARLSEHHWPGNLRELENTIERGVLLADGDTLTLDALPRLPGHAPEPEPEDDEEVTDSGVEVAEGQGLGLKEYVRVHTARLERARIQHALEKEQHNVTRAARRLGISRKALQLKMKEYGLREES